MLQLDEKELLLNEQKKEVHSKTKRLKAHLTQQEIVNNELEIQLRQKEAERVRKLGPFASAYTNIVFFYSEIISLRLEAKVSADTDLPIRRLYYWRGFIP